MGSFLPQVVGFLLLPVYTRLLTPTAYGIVELCSTIGMVVTVVSRMGLPGAISRFYFDWGEGPTLRDQVTTLTAFMLTTFGAFLGIACLVGPWMLRKWIPGVPFFPFVILTLIGGFFGVLPEVQRRLLQVREKAALMGVLNAANGIAGIVITLIFVAGFRWGAVGLISAGTMTTGIFALVAGLNIRDDLRGTVRMANLGPSLRYGLPLVPNHLGGWLLQMANRLVLGGLATVAEVGVFSVASRFVAPLMIIESAFNTAYIPIYFSLRSRVDRDAADAENRRLVTVTSLLYMWLSLGVSVFMPPLIILTTPGSYHHAGILVPVLALGILANAIYHMIGNEMFFAKKTRLVALITAAGGVVNVVLSILLVPRLGALGAAWSFAVGLVSTALIGWAINRRLYSMALPMGPLGVALAIAGILVALPHAMKIGPTAQLVVAVAVFLSFPALLIALRIVAWSHVRDLFVVARSRVLGPSHAKP